MSEWQRFPASTTPQQPKPIERHHSRVRHYAHVVHESLSTRVSKLICAVFLGLLLIVSMITFILWLSLRPHRPRIHIHDFTVPGLGQPTGLENAQITFNSTVRNSNQNIGIYYEAIDGFVFYRDQKIGAKALVESPFYQQPKTTTIVDSSFDGATLTVSSQRWAEFLKERAGGSVGFRLELTSVIRFKISSWKSKSHMMHASCDVRVGPDGQILDSFRNKKCPVYFS